MKENTLKNKNVHYVPVVLTWKKIISALLDTGPRSLLRAFLMGYMVASKMGNKADDSGKMFWGQ